MKTLNKSLLMSGVVGIALGASVFAHEGFDVLLLPDVSSGVLRTGSYDDATGVVVSENERVFLAEFGEAIPGEPNFADAPGFRALDGAFTPGDQWGFWITDAVRVWDSVAGHFDTLSTYTISLGFGPLSVTSATTPGGVVSGFDLTIPGGGFDDHLDVMLDAPTGPEADGIYLLRLSLRATGLAPSENIWFVYNRGMDELMHEAAEEYVRDVLVPAPGGAIGGALGVVITGARRGRRRA